MSSLYKNNYNDCPLTYALNIIGGKWRLPIIWALHKNETMRYNGLKREIDDITNIMLTQSLKDLEEKNIIIRTQYNEVPPRVEYSLNQNGEKLIPILKSLASWGIDVKTKE